MTELQICQCHIFSMRTTGDIASRYQDGDALRSIITGFSLDFLTDFAYAIWALVLLLTTNWQMCVIAIVIEELTLIIQYFFKKKMELQSKELMQAGSDVDSFVTSSFSASETVKNYNSEKLMEEGMEHRYKKYQEKNYDNLMLSEVQSNLVSTINNVGNIFMLGILGLFVMNGNITAGDLVKVYSFFGYIFAPINYLMSIQDEMYSVNAVLERLDDVFRTETEAEMDKKKKESRG